MPVPNSRDEAFKAGKQAGRVGNGARYPFAPHRDAEEDEELRAAFFAGYSAGRSEAAR